MRAYTGRGVRVLYDVVREPSAPTVYDVERPIASAECVARFTAEAMLGAELLPLEREFFAVLGLNTRHRTLGFQCVSVGTLNSAQVHPREVFRGLLGVGAAAFVAVHAHPSGDPSPSGNDRELTERLRKAGELLGVELLDHVIVGRGRAFSFALERATHFDDPRRER